MKKIIAFLLLGIVVLLSNSVYASTFYNGDDIKSDSVTMVNMDTDTVVFEKNANKRRSPASITKIMTYIVVCEKVANIHDTKITIEEDILKSLDGTESSLAGLQAGDVLSIDDLLHCLMIKSGNDAAVSLANYVGGGNIDNFVSMMNQKASEIGCIDTHFANPHGLYAENHYSTTSDICKLSKYALNMPGFLEMVSKVEYDVFKDGRPPLRTTNKMQDYSSGGQYYYPYVKGVKTGWFTDAGFCLVSTASKNNSNYMCVVLGAPQEDDEGKTTNFAMLDSKKLYSWAFDELRVKNLIGTDEPIKETTLDLAWRKDKLMLFPESSFSAVVPKNVSLKDLTMQFDVPEVLDAPIEQGDIIGTLTLLYGDSKVGTVNLISIETVPKSNVLFLIRTVSKILSSNWMKFLMCVFVIFFAIYILFTVKNNFKKKRTRRFIIHKNKFKNNIRKMR